MIFLFFGTIFILTLSTCTGFSAYFYFNPKKYEICVFLENAVALAALRRLSCTAMEMKCRNGLRLQPLRGASWANRNNDSDGV